MSASLLSTTVVPPSILVTLFFFRYRTLPRMRALEVEFNSLRSEFFFFSRSALFFFYPQPLCGHAVSGSTGPSKAVRFLGVTLPSSQFILFFFFFFAI